MGASAADLHLESLSCAHNTPRTPVKGLTCRVLLCPAEPERVPRPDVLVCTFRSKNGSKQQLRRRVGSSSEWERRRRQRCEASVLRQVPVQDGQVLQRAHAQAQRRRALVVRGAPHQTEPDPAPQRSQVPDRARDSSSRAVTAPRRAQEAGLDGGRAATLLRAPAAEEHRHAPTERAPVEHPRIRACSCRQQHHVASLAPPIQIPGKMDLSHQQHHHSHHHHPLLSHAHHNHQFAGPSSFLSSSECLVSPILSFAKRTPRFSEETTENERMGAGDEGEHENDDHDGEDDRAETRTVEAGETAADRHHRRSSKEQQLASLAADQVKEEHASPTGIDDFAPDSFLSICVSAEDNDAAYADLVPIMSTMSEKEMWTEDDIEFLQNLLLT
ncbi:hypothetical protein FI667_g14512, partial [Globisporangium splendens]